MPDPTPTLCPFGCGAELSSNHQNEWQCGTARYASGAIVQSPACKLRIAERERDEARKQRDDYKQVGKQFEADARKHFDQSCRNLARAEAAERRIAELEREREALWGIRNDLAQQLAAERKRIAELEQERDDATRYAQIAVEQRNALSKAICDDESLGVDDLIDQLAAERERRKLVFNELAIVERNRHYIPAPGVVDAEIAALIAIIDRLTDPRSEA